MQSKTDLNPLLFLVLLFLAALALLIGKNKYTKQDLASFYRVSKPTLSKWIIHFQQLSHCTNGTKEGI